MENPFQVLGIPVPKLFARDKDVQKIYRRLEKTVPDNVSIIGAKSIGKTVFLNAVANRFKVENKHFAACVYWNASYDTPSNDQEFYSEFGRQISKSSDKYRDYLGENTDYGEIKDFFEMLWEDKTRFLVIMDSLDSFLKEVDLSRDLWDRLRSLADDTGLRFVTGSRKRLREIVGSPEARVSPFWNIFGDSPQILAPFDADDWQQMLSPFQQRNINFENGAITEIKNFTGGIPVLASALCRRIWNETENNTLLGNDDITRMANGFVDDKLNLIEDIWNDCDESEKGVVSDITNGRSLKTQEVSHPIRLSLKHRGFITEDGSNLKICRTIENYVKNYNPQIGELRRILGREEDFKRNAIEILQLRLEQLQEVDEHLFTSLRFAIEKLNQPSLCIGEIRGLTNRAFTIIWENEMPDGKIPTDWTAGWRNFDSEGNRPENNPPEGNIPTAGGQKCYLLSLMTDSRKAGETKISRTTYFMIDYLQSVGDFGQHLTDEIVPYEFAYSVCLTAIEMCEQLTKDLSK